MGDKGADGAKEAREYSEATQRVFARTLEKAAEKLSESQRQALQALINSREFHDVNAIVRAIRGEEDASAD